MCVEWVCAYESVSCVRKIIFPLSLKDSSSVFFFLPLTDKLPVLGPRVCQLEIISDGGGQSEVRLMFDVEGSLMVV